MRLNLLILLAAMPLAAQVTDVPEGYRWDFLPLGTPRTVTNDGRIVGNDYLRNSDGAVISLRFPGSSSTTAVAGTRVREGSSACGPRVSRGRACPRSIHLPAMWWRTVR